MVVSIFILVFSVLHSVQATKVAWDENFPQDSSNKNSNEKNYLGVINRASIMYSLRSSSKVARTKKHYNKVCGELSKFTPNLCTYAKAKERCSRYCDIGKKQPGKYFQSVILRIVKSMATG